MAVRTTGPHDPGIAFNIAVCTDDPKLATPKSDWLPVALSLSHSHLNQGFKNCLHGAESDVERVISMGVLSMELVQRADPEYAGLCLRGMRWEIPPSYRLATDRITNWL